MIEPAASDVVEAIRRVIRDMPAVGKTHDMQGGTGQAAYAYRSIEDIVAAVKPLMAHHGVVLVPHVVESREREFTMGKFDTRWTDTYTTISFTAYGPGGPEDKITIGPIEAIGRDNSDKGHAKALTQGRKLALTALFQIADQGADMDGVIDEVSMPSSQSARQSEPVAEPKPHQSAEIPWWAQRGFASKEEAEEILVRLADKASLVDKEHRSQVREVLIKQGLSHPSQVSKEHVSDLEAAMDAALQNQAQNGHAKGQEEAEQAAIVSIEHHFPGATQ